MLELYFGGRLNYYFTILLNTLIMLMRELEFTFPAIIVINNISVTLLGNIKRKTQRRIIDLPFNVLRNDKRDLNEYTKTVFDTIPQRRENQRTASPAIKTTHRTDSLPVFKQQLSRLNVRIYLEVMCVRQTSVVINQRKHFCLVCKCSTVNSR